MSQARSSPTARNPSPPSTGEFGDRDTSALERLFTRDFVLIMAMQFLFGISFSSFLILPKFLKLELAASAQEIGWMGAAALGSAAFFSPVVGAATSRFDRRLILLVAILAEAGAALAFLTVDRIGPLALTLRCAQGLAFVAVFTGNSSLVADTVKDEHLGRALGYLGASMLVTNALAPLLAEPVATHFGWSYVFGGAAIASLSTLGLIAQLRPARSGGHSTANDPIQSISPVGVAPIQLGSLLMGAGLGVMFTYTQPYAIERGASEVGQLFLGYAVSATFVRVALGGLSDRIGPARSAAAALTLYGVTVLLTSGLEPALLVYLGAALGVSHGFLYPALTAAGLCVIRRNERGRFLGWFAFCFNLGFALTVLFLGPVADRYGYPPIFVATGLALLGGVLPLLRFGRRTPRIARDVA